MQPLVRLENLIEDMLKVDMDSSAQNFDTESDSSGEERCISAN